MPHQHGFRQSLCNGAKGVEKACRDIVKKAGEEAEAAHKEAADWKERWEQALQKSNQLEIKVAPRLLIDKNPHLLSLSSQPRAPPLFFFPDKHLSSALH